MSDCIFEIYRLWHSDFSRVYSNCSCRCSFEPEIIKISQSSQKIYSNNIVYFQESTTILNAHTKKVWKLILCTSCVCVCVCVCVCKYFCGMIRSFNLSVNFHMLAVKDTSCIWDHYLNDHSCCPWNIDISLLCLSKNTLYSFRCVKVKLATVIEGDQKAPFSIATTPRCRGGRYSFPWIATLYSWYVPNIAEC